MDTITIPAPKKQKKSLFHTRLESQHPGEFEVSFNAEFFGWDWVTREGMHGCALTENQACIQALKSLGEIPSDLVFAY